MNESLLNSPITRRYISSLIFEYEKTVHTFGENSSVIALLPTFTKDEFDSMDRDAYTKLIAFWKELESMKVVKMHGYIKHLETVGLDISEGIETREFDSPFERVDYEKEVKVEVLDIDTLRSLQSEFNKVSNPNLSLISGLKELSRGHTVHLNQVNKFAYNENKHSLRLDFGTQPYFVLASVIRHTIQGDEIVTYQQIADDVGFPLSDKQKEYSLTKQVAERNRKISNCVNKISNEFTRVMERYAKDGEMLETDMISIETVPTIGVKMINPSLY
jgi:hypothetical protein